jgi:hypothetical protein
MRSMIHSVVNSTASRSRLGVRLDRMGIYAAVAHATPRYQEIVAQELTKSRKALEAIIRVAQEKGVVDPTLDPDVSSAFILSYTFGKVLSDISSEPVDDNAWSAFIEKMIDLVFLSSQA